MTVDVALNSVAGINIKVSSNFEFKSGSIRKSLLITYYFHTFLMCSECIFI